MRYLVLLSVLCPAFCSLATAADLAPEEVIQKFAAREAEFRKARESYTYRQSVKMEELDGSGNVQGKWEEIDDIIFGPNKQREEKVVYAPMNTLHLIITPQDLQDLRNVQPFVLTTDDIGKYDIHYVGKQKVDEIDCYQFNVKPKTMLKGATRRQLFGRNSRIPWSWITPGTVWRSSWPRTAPEIGRMLWSKNSRTAAWSDSTPSLFAAGKLVS